MYHTPPAKIMLKDVLDSEPAKTERLDAIVAVEVATAKSYTRGRPLKPVRRLSRKDALQRQRRTARKLDKAKDDLQQKQDDVEKALSSVGVLPNRDLQFGHANSPTCLFQFALST